MERLMALLLLFVLFSGKALAAENWAYEAYDGPLCNPLEGNAVWAHDLSDRPQPFTLVYANITWAELEPQKGVYDFSGIEEKNHFDAWRQQGKHIILRFVMDVPGKKKHSDLPEWLRTRTEGDWYRTSYGQGWCPDYSDPVLMAAHKAAVLALGQRYDADPFVSFIELGSLGHWGEWHVHSKAGKMPPSAEREAYIRDYLEAFSKTHLMMRRPFQTAAKEKMGLFNDMAGDVDATLEWLDWIENGGAYQEEESGLSAMAEAWKQAPVGGELTTSRTPERLLSQPETLLRLFRLSHTAWIGPNSFAEVRNRNLQSALDTVLSGIGSRLRITEAHLEGTRLSLEVTNDGIAPFYYDWPLAVAVTDLQGERAVLKTDLDIRTLLPGKTGTASVLLPSEKDWQCLEAGILDPMTGQPAMKLAMKTAFRDGWNLLAEKEE